MQCEGIKLNSVKVLYDGICERGSWCAWPFSRRLLTGGKTTVGATQVDVALRNCCHAKLVIGTSEKGSKSTGKYYVPLPGSTSHGNTDLVKEMIVS